MSEYTDAVNKLAWVLIREWERVENTRVSPSYMATFADMARAILRDENSDDVLSALETAGRLSSETKTLDDGYASMTTLPDGTVMTDGRPGTVQRRYVSKWRTADG